MKPVVILCSDDAEFCLLLQHILEIEGYSTCMACRPEQVVRLAQLPATRAILLDCQSERLDPKDFGEALRRSEVVGRVPIAALVGSGSDAHIALLEAGVDTNLVRPLAPARLLQFLSTGATEGPNENELGRLAPSLTLKQLEIELNAARQCALFKGRSLDLSPIGFRLLQFFVCHPDQVHSRSDLAAAAWRESRQINPRTVDVQVGRLRRSLRSLCGSEVIRTVRSAGYRFESVRMR